MRLVKRKGGVPLPTSSRAVTGYRCK